MKTLVNTKTLFLTLLFTIASSAAFAQRGAIKGTVVDAATGEPLIGTTIIIEGTTIGTTADAEGNFTISNIIPGPCVITARYLGYEVFTQRVNVTASSETQVRIPLMSSGINLEDVVVIAQINEESESVLLSGQKQAVVASQAVGAAEMSRKGISNAQAAVSQVSGISKQDGVKNVFVRGLGDRYNATFLNGFPLPSEDPEYKNIALEFFGSDIIRNIGVNKVFTAANNGDVGGAAIDIRSKELLDTYEFSVSIDGGVNSEAVGARFLRNQDGVNYLGMSNPTRPTLGQFDFPNSLDPSTVKLPVNHSYGISGGRRWEFGEKGSSLSLFAVASHSSDYSFTEEIVRNAISNGSIYQDLKGQKSTIDTRQLALAGVDLKLNRRHEMSYNFLLIHANEQYVGDYTGKEERLYVDAADGESGFMRRQQSNDNLLITNQLSSRWTLGDRWDVSAGVAHNSIKGLEPDRRENNLSLQGDGRYKLTGSNNQRRFFSELRENDVNLRAALRWKIVRARDIDRSNITLGYRGRIVGDRFTALDYNMYDMFSERFSTDDLHLDGVYNGTNFSDVRTDGKFTVKAGEENRYRVSKMIHSGYLEATHQFSERFSANVGVLLDYVDMEVDYHVQTVPPGTQKIEKLYTLPSASLKYDITEKHSLRLGLSKSYTLPQSKEIAPYQYINISFASEGNPDLKPSDNYNADLKWDWYMTSSEIISLGVFYKNVVDPIGRVDQGNSARLLTYENIAPRANVAGVEMEVRKNIINTTTIQKNMRRLSVGLNASYIYSDMELDIVNTPRRHSALEGASPLLVNGDVSYNYSSGERALNVSLVAGWFSDRIHTLGTRGYDDIIEESVLTMSAVASYKINSHWTVKFKAGNLLNPALRLTREYAGIGRIVMGEYRKGIDVSVGVSFEL